MWLKKAKKHHFYYTATVRMGIRLTHTFHHPRLSLLDRGFVFAIAHIRGGQELGRQWYEDGKFLKKEKIHFTDFIACGEHLITEGYTTPDMLFGQRWFGGRFAHWSGD